MTIKMTPGIRLTGSLFLFALVTLWPVHLSADEDDPADVEALRKVADRISMNDDGNVYSIAVGWSSNRNIGDTLTHLGGLPSLRDLSIGSATDVELEVIRHNTELHRLRIISHHLTDDAIQTISEMTSLKELRLTAINVTERGLSHLAKLENLESLTLFTRVATDETMKGLSELKSLRVLKLVEPKITNKGMEHISHLENLEELDLCAVYRIGGGFTGPDRESMNGNQVDDEGMQHIAKLTNLKKLALTNTRVGKGLEALSDLPLNELILDKTDLTDDDLAHLADMPNLRRLSLKETQISDGAVDTLANLPALKRLSLFGSQISDEGFQELRKRTIADIRK